MSEQISEELQHLAIWTSILVRSSQEFREHCCEFSKFLVQNVADDCWLDVAVQLLGLLGDVDELNKDCRERLAAHQAMLVKAVAELNLPKPPNHLSWTIWTIEHWQYIAWSSRLGIQLALKSNNVPEFQWFYQKRYEAYAKPDRCLELSKTLFVIGERFKDFDQCEEIITRVNAECMGSRYLSVTPPKPKDHPIKMYMLCKLCVGKKNRAGVEFARGESTVYGWQKSKDWPNPATWNSVRKFVNDRKDFDIGEPRN